MQEVADRSFQDILTHACLSGALRVVARRHAPDCAEGLLREAEAHRSRAATQLTSFATEAAQAMDCRAAAVMPAQWR